MKSILLIALSVLCSFSVLAETNAKSNKETAETKSVSVTENVQQIRLTGSVVDDKNKETLVGATLQVDGKKYYSDLDGNFCISDIKPGKHQIEVMLISYHPVTVEIDTKNQQEIKICLQQN
ncbi:MAG: carboxypeptidase-like regulatory domain-containing protein [Culturomica sp.]|nr:carboxypeptidase-like regulatory domain-containing protein [Culturomica sp.]